MGERSDIAFLDTETLGLHPDAPIWEFAAIRRAPDGRESRLEMLIEHDAGDWLHDFPDTFKRDYASRYDYTVALPEPMAANLIQVFTAGCHVIGACPSFDTIRLDKLLTRNNLTPGWHYHLTDVENIVVGYLAGRGQLMPPPWKSDDLSAAVGIDPDHYARHTAMGDVLWCKAQWDAVMTEAFIPA